MGMVSTTHDLGKLFWHTIRLEKGSPLVHRHPTHEIDPPYRWSNSLVLRMPMTKFGLTIGWWHTTKRTEEEAILAGMSGRDMSYTELTEQQKSSVRRLLSKVSTSYDDEMELAQQLGVM